MISGMQCPLRIQVTDVSNCCDQHKAKFLHIAQSYRKHYYCTATATHTYVALHVVLPLTYPVS